MTTFYRPDSSGLLTCVTRGKARGRHLWSDAQDKLLCVEPKNYEQLLEAYVELMNGLESMLTTCGHLENEAEYNFIRQHAALTRAKEQHVEKRPVHRKGE
jgi:hypothetical protein